MKVVIIGGVAAGASAAARLRRLDEKAEIIVFERSGYISYANCGLPYYIGDVITQAKNLTLQTPQSFWKRFRVKMNVWHEVIAIESKEKRVAVKNLKTGECFHESYDKLLLAPGAKPFLPPGFSGQDLPQVFTLRTVEDTFAIKNYITQNTPTSVVLVGGGFIGLELAENLKHLGLDVAIVQSQEQVMLPFDADMASFLHNTLRQEGIRLILGQRVIGLKAKGEKVSVLLKEDSLEADLVILAMGVSPESTLAKEAGLLLGQKESILVNDKLETSDPHIYAAGDAVEVEHRVSGQKVLLPLAGPANKQGRIVADNMCGGDSHYLGSQGSSILKVFELTAATTGLNESVAKQAGFDVDTVILSPTSHATYYPGGKVMTIKIVFEKKGMRLLGAQIIGYEGVDKRIDVLATAIFNEMRAPFLKDLDLAYAPPYSSAKDPVNMAGFLAENIEKGVMKQWHLSDLNELPTDGSVTFLDVRTKSEVEKEPLSRFEHIPVDELRERISELDLKKPIYVICQSGLRSYIACRILEGFGFTAYNFAGGARFYLAVTKDQVLIKKGSPCGMEEH